MATDTQSLLDSATCYECSPPGQWEILKLALLKQILLASSPMADTSVQGLLTSASCYACAPPGLWPLLELALLQQIVSGGGGGGSGGTVGVVDPEGVVTADPGASYYNTANSTFWIKASGTGTNTGWTNVV